MSDIDQQFIEYVVKSLVGKPGAVQIDRRIDEKGVLLELTVDPEDLGRVIGKRGATAQSLRTLLRALGTKNDARYNLKIIDNGPADRPGAEPATRPSAEPDSGQSASTQPVGDTDDSEATETKPEPVEPKPKKVDSNEEHEAKTSDRLAQARAELADLDDLDV